MIGGAYLCYEGAEKVWHLINPADHHAEDLLAEKLSDAHLEEQKVKGAIKTDFILSAEIMTIALAALPAGVSFWMEFAVLLVVAIGITVMVYGGVGLIVKADDLGLLMARSGRLAVTRTVGELIVRGMPGFMKILMTVGTAAMLWVGGSIVVHGAAELGWHAPEEVIHHWAEAVAHAVGTAEGAVAWFVKAVVDGLLGLGLGLLLIPFSAWVITPVAGLFARKA
jgi:predicted DNA repair protein MutK